MPRWVQLLREVGISEQGKRKTYRRGDWVQVGNSQALEWLANGTAMMPKIELAALTEGCGVVPWGGAMKVPGLLNTPSETPTLVYPKTFLWGGGIKLRTELIPTGMHLLDKWELAAPLFSYTQLANEIDTDAARARTKEIIHDLRVPYYEPRALFVRKCPACERLLNVWQEEQQHGGLVLAFLRAVYIVKPIICALPISWIGRHEE